MSPAIPLLKGNRDTVTLRQIRVARPARASTGPGRRGQRTFGRMFALVLTAAAADGLRWPQIAVVLVQG